MAGWPLPVIQKLVRWYVYIYTGKVNLQLGEREVLYTGASTQQGVDKITRGTLSSTRRLRQI